MGLIVETAGVFDFIKAVYAAFPVAIKLLTLGSFGGVVFIAVLRGIRG
ncbi:hypothetical protein SDC9_65421 [bioreactor metagenome]|uniref:Uncharacterized protein n=1 Tax=bioreactor metagenome TaxID=1076179 RepID=A0A644XXJ0_9ZZZZ